MPMLRAAGQQPNLSPKDFHTYMVFLSAPMLANLAKVKGIPVCDENMGELPTAGQVHQKATPENMVGIMAMAKLTAVNLAGPAVLEGNSEVSHLELTLDFHCIHPVLPPPETFTITGKYGDKEYKAEFTRRSGSNWPDEILSALRGQGVPVPVTLIK